MAVPADAVLVLTSGRAVDAVTAGAGPRALEGRLAYCVGDRTAALAAEAGARTLSARGTVEDLLALLLRDRPGRLVHLRAQHGRGDLIPRLRAEGIEGEEREVYRMQDCPPTPEALRLLQGDRPVVAPVFSPRSARNLAQLPISAPVHIVAISPAAAQHFEGRFPTETAARPDAAAMQDLVLGRLGNLH
ncbi:uroporphyrinogen-III synthase [Frigidibacter sp. ROC022]|uniref:uroporphyrinogen-III synthase n=1 Tax=Frigidibacter sp. ROC022 TaxID=2971796 RepID=UPI00215B36F9|nr:uroporphyrinogen-III synthase [Frigidibacter sp. ROC022]